jgi:hypothetical protein
MVDRCANYNAFGYDPKGELAYAATALWGPDYVPPFPSKVYVGALEPPRYGPPATYQVCCLPPGWIPNPPPGPAAQPMYLHPPSNFDAGLFDGLKYNSAFVNNTEWNNGMFTLYWDAAR